MTSLLPASTCRKLQSWSCATICKNRLTCRTDYFPQLRSVQYSLIVQTPPSSLVRCPARLPWRLSGSPDLSYRLFYAAFFWRFSFATLAACFPNAVLVALGKCAIVRFFLRHSPLYGCSCVQRFAVAHSASSSPLMAFKILHCAFMGL